MGVTECTNCRQRASGRYCANCGQRQPTASGGSGRVLAALWLGLSQAIAIGTCLVVVAAVLALSNGVRPFYSATVGDPTFGFLSGITLRASLPLFGLVIAGGMILGIVVGSWKLWARGKHGWAVQVSSLPYLLLLAMVGAGVILNSL